MIAGEKHDADWSGSIGSYALIWGVPLTAIIASLWLDVPTRTVIWTLSLIWMGTACILNARRCGRTHCRYTGPYYLAMIVPVLVLGSAWFPAGIEGWIVLGVIIIGGSRLIRWSTERAWGKFFRP